MHRRTPSSRITRRAVLLTGGAGVAVAAGGATALQLGRDIDAAREPWRTAGRGFEDVRLDALAHAVLAPSPHNRQPWLVKLEGEDRLTLFADPDRLLPETDPFNRQVVIGLGAFLELLRMAAARRGVRARIDSWPEGEPQPLLDARPVARVRLVSEPTVARDPLFAAVLDRRTVRTPFEDRPVAPEAMAAIGSVLDGPGAFAWTDDPAEVADLKAMADAGWIVETGLPRTHHESTKLVRVGADEVVANPDGIALHGPVMEAYHLSGMLTHETYDDPGSRAFAASRSFYEGLIDGAPAFGWLASPGNTRADQLRAGADWVRLHLAATRAGIAMHPLSQVLQEFPEMRVLHDRFHDLVGMAPPARVQGLFRLGHAVFPEPAPRWPMRSRLVEA